MGRTKIQTPGQPSRAETRTLPAFAVYVFTLLLFGLPEIWFLTGARLGTGKPVTPAALLGSGGLVFFTTTLFFTSAYDVLFASAKRTPDNALRIDSPLRLGIAFLSWACATGIFVGVELRDRPSGPAPFGEPPALLVYQAIFALGALQLAWHAIVRKRRDPMPTGPRR